MLLEALGSHFHDRQYSTVLSMRVYVRTLRSRLVLRPVCGNRSQTAAAFHVKVLFTIVALIRCAHVLEINHSAS